MRCLQICGAAVLSVCATLVDAQDAASALRVTDPHVRAVPPGQPNSAVFMALTNPLGEDRALVRATSPAAQVVELHTHTLADGMMQMRAVEQIPLPAGTTVRLRPGGLHIMLIGLHAQLAAGDDVMVVLMLDDGSSRQIHAPVRDIVPVQRSGPGGGPAAGGTVR